MSEAPTGIDHTVLVEVACPIGESAGRIGSSAVVRGLAASAHQYPTGSTYRWNEEVHHENEILLQLTTTHHATADLVDHIRREHPYQTPHIVIHSVHDLPDGHAWVKESVHVRTPGKPRSGPCYITLNVTNLPTQTLFWSTLLNAEPSQVSTGSSQTYAVIRIPHTGMRLLLQKVPHHDPSPSRMHLDLHTDDVEADTQRALQAGAALQRVHQENGFRWSVLTDPEGNEFCILEVRYPHLLEGAPPHHATP